MSVSYTHLDVYKRQMEWNAMDLSGRGYESTSDNVTCSLLAGPGPGSYDFNGPGFTSQNGC